jgi:hypothetical protein
VHATRGTELVSGSLQAAGVAAGMRRSRAKQQVQQGLLHSEDGQQYASSASTRGKWYRDETEHDGCYGEYAESR